LKIDLEENRRKYIMQELLVGDKIPDFTLPSDLGEDLAISSLRGKKIVIYFYPKDDTPGCTIEAKDFTCAINGFENLNTVVIGISKDSIKKHEKFRSKYELKHILLSDLDGKICEMFNCWIEKSMYGKKYMGVARKTFLIDTMGNIVKIWPNVKIPGHVEDVINSIKGLDEIK
jgi:peroxiredoxin Q/BCP